MRWTFDEPYPEDREILAGLMPKSSSAAGNSDPKNIKADGHALQIADLADAIRTGRSPMMSAQDGRRTVDFICGVYDAVRTGKMHVFC